jgi:hypothetical protein
MFSKLRAPKMLGPNPDEAGTKKFKFKSKILAQKARSVWVRPKYLLILLLMLLLIAGVSCGIGQIDTPVNVSPSATLTPMPSPTSLPPTPTPTPLPPTPTPTSLPPIPTPTPTPLPPTVTNLTDEEIVEKYFAHADYEIKENRIVQLVFQDNQSTSLPPEIGQLKNLQELDLLRNALTSVPPEIGQLKNLQKLDLEDNQLTSLPPEIGQLNNLQKLDLTGNPLTSLPPEVEQLPGLRIIR